jgi:hypothetical protein
MRSIFIRILLDKKYVLPYRVVDALVHHFIQFQIDARQLPVLWHQTLLTFVQRYKSDISSEQKKEALLAIIKVHLHHEITNEIRRELNQAKCRDIECNEDANSQHSVDLIILMIICNTFIIIIIYYLLCLVSFVSFLLLLYGTLNN